MSSIVAVLQMLLTTKGTVLTSPKLKLNYVKGLNYGNSNEPDGDFEDRNAIKAVSEAKRPVTKVEEVKMMIRLLPIWATTIIFWTCYAQMMTFSLSTTSIHHRKLSNPRCLSHRLLCVSHYESVITLAFNDRVIIPLWKKWKGQPGTYMNTPQQTDY
ncbi:unnamed protein product [Prunus armeniaca]|uniref:Uncharacterized protein n=1 Tax=Prunus armeniaca TaxID=36596 RepID=A0A6J5Y3H1_PRUAR|nr:unnamed protein product [Prunus armeniaca]